MTTNQSNPMTAITKPAAPSPSAADAFGRLVNLQELFFTTETKLVSMQTNVDKELAFWLESIKADYVANKTVRDQAEAEIKALALAHPEWKDGETIKTPFGTIQFRSASKLEVASEERTLATLEITAPEMAAKLTRTETTLNREALESVPDETLELLGVKRVTTTSITVKPARVDLGKAANPKTVKTTDTTKATKGKAGK